MADKKPRFYQETAINRALQAILQGKRRVLLTMATGTGKTFVAFQICWKLWQSRWNRSGDHRRPRILYLADRNILIDDPKDKIFVPFGDARHRIENGEVVKSREMYFAIYQAIAQDERRPGLYREFGREFFDLVIVDECHRGSASDESNWRAILEFYDSAYQLGMTATPKRSDNIDTYAYFGNPAQRDTVIAALHERGISFANLAIAARQPDTDPLDLLCHLAFNAPLRTRRERAERLRKNRKDFFDQYGPEARAILEELLEKYATHGPEELRLPEVLQVPPISTHGNVMGIAERFGGADRLKEAVDQLQALFYAA